MPKYNKIAWSDGMFLGPHHFQQCDRYHEGLLHSRLKSIMPFYWGLVDLNINEETLENGNFMLISCRVVFPEGLYIDIPKIDETPPSRSVEGSFDKFRVTLGVYLAVPTDHPGSVNCNLENDESTRELRYSRIFVPIVDENSGEDEQQIPIAKKNLKILFENESLDQYDCLKIAELERTQTGSIKLKSDYIPSCISISASLQLKQMIGGLISRLITKSDAFRKQCLMTVASHNKSDIDDMLNRWHLQNINSFIPELNHFYREKQKDPQGHPEDLYHLLVRFAGSLTAFSSSVTPVDLPEYNHNDLTSSFKEINTHILKLLDDLFPISPSQPAPPPPSKHKFIPLNKVPAENWKIINEASIDYDILGPSYQLYIAIKGEGEGEDRQLIDNFQGLVKITSTNEIEIDSSRKGVGIMDSAENGTHRQALSDLCADIFVFIL